MKGIDRLVYVSKAAMVRVCNPLPILFTERSADKCTAPREIRLYALEADRLWQLERGNFGPHKISVLLSTYRPEMLPWVLSRLANQYGVQLQVIVCAHGFTVSNDERRCLAVPGMRIEWLETPSDKTLGSNYSKMLERVDAPFVAKIDDDDWYGPGYLLDAVSSLLKSGADIVGKRSNFIYLESQDKVYLRFPNRHNRFVTSVAGPTIVARTEIFHCIGFSDITHGEDQDFLRRALMSGAKIFSTGPFWFCQRRSGSNTWQVSDEYITQDASFVHAGAPGTYELL